MRIVPFKVLFFMVCAFFLGVTAVQAQQKVTLNVIPADHDLERPLRNASLVLALQNDGAPDADDVFGAALAEYGQLTQTLYEHGYYSGVINVLVNGAEAGLIDPFHTPQTIQTVKVVVTPGKRFTFGVAKITPLSKGAVLPEGFKKGETAKSTLIQLAAEAGVKEWREVGHAKAKLTGQDITANHDTARLNAVLTLSPGPKLRFGNLRQTTQNAVRSERIARIAGLPTGEVFSPAQLDKVAKRLRRTGAFSSVTLSESDTVSPNDTLDIGLALVDQKPRRFGGGAEVSSLEGLKLSAFWMHRNAFGGGERFRIDGEVKNIKGQHGGVDYLLSARLDQPATFGADTNGFIFARATYEDEPHYLSRSIDLGVGMTRLLSDNLELELGGAFRYSETTDVEGDRRFFLFTLPSALTWDNRDSQLDARSGMYIKAKATPFISLDTGGLGAWLHSDLRAYQQLGTSKDFILAGRVQVGSVFAQNYGDIPPDYLFYSGGGGSVRGQPYQSLGQTAADGSVSGGASFVSVSAELRAKVTNTIGVVGFVDAGQVTSDSFLSGQSEWHAGAGVGLRYQTPLGPLRFDVATPILGDTGDGVQLYLGIGQAF